MCGIAGIATRDGLRDGRPAPGRRMLACLAHRGPDDHFTSGDGRARLGASRLSIIDLEGGRQPLTDESGLILASQNGEIYNYVELRTDLERRGHHADHRRATPRRSSTCTRSTGRLRRAPARACSRSRSGTAGTGRLVLARDRLGKKPLYWRLADGRLTYGSELKAILRGSATSSGSSTARRSTSTSSTSTSRRRGRSSRASHKLPAGERPDVGRRRTAHRAVLDARPTSRRTRDTRGATSTRACR